MGYSNIKRVLAAALIVAFTAPSTFAISGYGDAEPVAETPVLPYRSSMMLNGEVKLTESNDTITLSLRDSDAKQVLRMFADKAGLNIVFHNSVSGKVTLDLVNTPINEAFKLVLQVTGLNYYKQGNTMIVMSKDTPDNSLYSKQEMMVFPIKYVNAAKVADFLNKNVFGMKKPGLSSIDAATVNSATNELIVFGMPGDAVIINKVIEQFDKEPFARTFAVNHTTPAEMANMICNVLLPSRGMGGGSSSDGGAAPAGGAGDMTDLFGAMTGGAADLGDVGGGSGELKLGEGIVACSSSSAASSGAVSAFDVQNLSIAYFPQRGTITMMGGSEAQANMIEKFIKEHDIKQPQAYLELSIIELNESGSKEFRNMWEVQSKHFSMKFDGESTSGGSTLGNIDANYIPIVRHNWLKDDDGKVTFESVEGMQLVEGTKLKWTMNYLIKNSKGRVLANPKILITNGQESVIDLTQDYVEKVTSEYLTSSFAGGAGAGTVQKTYTIGDDMGIKVSLIPFISPEGYVTMNIKPEYSTMLEKIGSGGATNSSDVVATLLSRRNLDLKNVRIKDGETLVIGGMIQENEQKVVGKIPFLGDLPVIGSLFRSSKTDKIKNELVIMITPKIINDDEGAIADSL